MPQASLARGNEIYDWLTQTSFVWSAATVASTTAELTAAFPGVLVGDYVDMYLLNAAMTTGLTISNIRVSANNVIAVTWVATSGTFTIPTGPYIVNIVRPESFANLPASAI